MKRVLIVLLLLALLAPVGAVLAFNMGVFQSALEAKANSAAGVPVKLGPMRLLYTWPLHLRVGATSLNHPVAKVEFEVLDVIVTKITPPYALVVEVRKPRVEVVSTDLPKTPAGAAPASGAAAVGPPLNLDLKLIEGEILAKQGSVKELNLHFKQKQLMKSPAWLRLQGLVKTSYLPGDLPVALETDTLTFGEEAVKTSGVRLSLAGLTANLSGTSLLKESRHRWLIDVSVPDLTKLPRPPMNLPARDWRGKVEARAEIQRLKATEPWQVDGAAKVEGFAAIMNYKAPPMLVTGPVSLSADVKFSARGEQFGISRLVASGNASGATVEYQGLLQKAAGVPLTVEIAGTGTPTGMNLESVGFRLWNLSTRVKGQLATVKPFAADLQVQIAPMDLAGIENVLPPLKSSPVQGRLELALGFKGGLLDPVAAAVKIDKISLKGFRAAVEYEKPGSFQVRGPVAADIEGRGEWAGKKVVSASATGQLNMSAAALVAGPLRKESKARLEARFAVQNKGEGVRLENVVVDSFFGRLVAKGFVEDPAAMKVDLQLALEPLNLSELRIAMPEYREKIPSGQLRAALRVAGRLDTAKPWQDWPLLVSGSADVHLPEYKLASEPAPPPSPGAKPPPPPPAGSFLPKGPLTAGLVLGIRARVDRLIKDQLIVKGIRAEGKLAAGKFTGSVKVEEVFGGRFEGQGLQVPLLDPGPIIQGTAIWQELVVQDALAFAKPEYKEFATGRTAGRAEFATVMPGEADFMARLKVKGDAGMQPVVLNSVKVGGMINEMMAKAPMLKLKPVKADPLKGLVKASFEMAAGVVNLPQLVAIDEDQSELRLKGKVSIISMQGDLAGTFFWAKPTLTGCLLEGNADKQGRMVIPLAIKGDLMSPGLSVLSDIAGPLARRALDCEKTKLVDKIKVQGKEKLETELKKQLKGLFGN